MKIEPINDMYLINRQINTNTYNETNINNIIINTVDYKDLQERIKDLHSDLTYMSPDDPRRLKKEERLNEEYKKLEELQKSVLMIAELFNRTTIDSKRIRIAREYFETGRLKEADAILKTEVIDREVEELKSLEERRKDELEKTQSQLAERAQEYVLKAQLQLTYIDDKERFRKAEELYEKALKANRNAENLFSYAYYLQNQNQHIRSEFLYTEALSILRKLAKSNPGAYESYVANTLNNLGVLHRAMNQHSQAEEEYTEALSIRRKLAEK